MSYIDWQASALATPPDSLNMYVVTDNGTPAISYPMAFVSFFTAMTDGGAITPSIPIAAALADNTANPTTICFGSMNMVWDGATWDRLPGDSTNGAKVQLSGTAQTDIAAVKTAVELLDNVVETGRAAVNLISGQAGVAADGGAFSAGTQRVAQAVASSYDHFAKTDVGTTAAALTSVTAKVGVMVKAPLTNTADVYIGNSDVTTGTAATKGYPLSPGEAATFPVSNANLLYVVSTAASQEVNVIVF